MKFPSLSVKHTYKLFKVSARLHYDPLGRVERTDYPDGTYEKTVWTSWDQLFYDRNDTVGDSDWYVAHSMGTAEEQDAAAKALAHNNTPTLQYLDTLARPFYTVQYLEDMDTEDPPGPETIGSYVTLDIQGNRLQVTDGRGKDTLTYRYNMLQSVCRQQSLDSGGQRILVDAAGQPFCGWDTDDRQTRFTYDDLRRPVTRELWLYDDLAEAWELEQTLEELEYGEDQTDDQDHNLRGQLYQSRDGAGVVTVPDYDFKGNPLSSVRQYTADATKHPDWTGSVALEEDDNDDPVLYTTATTYDALSRPVTLTTPEGGVTSYAYDRGGLLYSVDVAGVHGLSDDMVTVIEYDAKGQRQKIQYGNGTTTTYAYDPDTFRVTRIRTTRHSDSAVLQDLQYWYDPVGNITEQKDRSWDYSTKEQRPYFGDEEVKRPHNKYTYDALYRLTEARGREHQGNNTAPDHGDSSRRGFWPIPVGPSDTAKMRRYTQYYEYDAVGNMLQMQHTVTGGTGNWTRYYTIDTDSNRLLESVIGAGTPEAYIYDSRGNLTGTMGHLTGGMTYNAENRLESVQLTATRWAYYQYDSVGQRVRKTIKDSSAVAEMRKYVGGWETYSKYTGSTLDIERESLHVSDDTGRIVLIETQTNVEEEEVAPVVRYQYSNHLGSATLELDEVGAIISYEEYYPYGSTSFQAGRSTAEVSLKRYRYTGKERDEETGLYYHGARYYIPWLARWSAVDPLQGEMPEWSPYNYGYCNPITWTDSTGMNPENWHPPMQMLGPAELSFSDGVPEMQHSGGTLDGIEVVDKAQSDVSPLSEVAIERIKADAYMNVHIDPANRQTVLMMREGWKDSADQKITQEIERLTEFALKGQASNLKEMILLASYQRSEIEFVGDVIEMIKNDPDFKRFEQEALQAFENGETSYPGGLTLGGRSLEEYLSNPRGITDLVTNPLIWMLRHADVAATATYDNEANLNVEYLVTDELNLDPHDNELFYNSIAVPLGKIWGDGLKHSFPSTKAVFTIKY